MAAATGKKFFMASSLVAKPGSVQSCPPTKLVTVKHKSLDLLASMMLQMETAPTLKLRFPGLLRADNPAHQPILDMLAPQQEDPVVAEEPAAAPMASLPAARAIIKPEVKPEVKPEGPAPKRRRTGPIHIDLT